MQQTWGFFLLLIGILVQSLLHASKIIINDYSLIVFILLSLVFFVYDLSIQFPQKLRKAIIAVSIIRFVIMLWNVYGRDIYLLFGVGTDSEGFYNSAILISQNLSLLKTSIYGEYFSKYLGLIFSLTGPSYLLGSYLNYLYGLLSIRFLNDILKKIINIDNRVYVVSIFLFAFAPVNMMLCSSLRRESVMIMFAVLSLKKLFQWVETGRISCAILSVVFILVSSIFHAGIIGLALGYIFLFLFYNPIKKVYTFNIKTIVAGVVISLVIIIIVSQFSSVFLAKLLYADEDILFDRLSKFRGGAAYLTTLQISSIQNAILYSPLKIFYFLFSPVPWEWRGTSDIIAFALDSLVYLFLVIEVAKKIKNSGYPVKWAICLIFLGGLFIFAMGTQNAGTAMRHRCKLLALLSILFCIVNTFTENKEDSKSLVSAGELFHTGRE